MIIVGKQDPVVCNETAKKVFDLLPSENKKFQELEELDHGPFSDATLYDSIIVQAVEWFQLNRSQTKAQAEPDESLIQKVKVDNYNENVPLN